MQRWFSTLLAAGLVLWPADPAQAHEGDAGHAPVAHYLGNEGVLVTHGDTKVLFDPLFREVYGQYERVPEDMEAALFAGDPPFDGVDAVFVSHYHGDHFAPAEMLELLRAHPALRLWAPEQAARALRDAAGDGDGPVLERVHAVALAYRDAPVRVEAGDLVVEGVRIPHSGWPTRRLDVENIAWRVSLGPGVTVTHFGDADPNPVHFGIDAEHWRERPSRMIFPPYWFFPSAGGRRVLRDFFPEAVPVGIHVPADVPDSPAERPPELQAFDLFTRPGETRAVPLASERETAAANAALMRRYYDEVFNRRNLDFLRDHLHPDVVGHGPGADDIVRGREQVAAFSAYVYEVYDDYRLTVEDVIAEADRVVVRGRVSAMHKPTGKPVSFFGITEYRIEAGLVREYWRAYDRLDLYERQLGGWRP